MFGQGAFVGEGPGSVQNALAEHFSITELKSIHVTRGNACA